MGNSNQTGAEAPKKQLSIVTRIAALLKLDDAGRLEKFFTREIKKLERGIAAIEANKKTAKMNYDLDLIKVSEEIEDLQQAVEDAYEGVSVDAIKTNADSDAFAEKYWEAIEIAERHLETAEKHSKKLTEEYNDKVEALDEDIRVRKERINKLR